MVEVPILPELGGDFIIQSFIEANFGSWWLFLLLLGLSFLAGIIRGKTEGDTDPAMKNVTPMDWLEDGGYGIFGFIIFIALYPDLSKLWPNMSIWFGVVFAWAGRMLLIKIGKKAEDTINSR